MQFVKGFFRRPFRGAGGDVAPTGGGRVTELTARPLLQAFYPELAQVRQPLAGEMAGRRELLERIPFCTGYAVETGLLLDVYADGRASTALAQVDLDVRQNRHQSLEDLAPMADAVLAAVTSRLHREGRLLDARRRSSCSSARRSPSCARCAPRADPSGSKPASQAGFAPLSLAGQASSRSQIASSASVARRRAPRRGVPSPNVSRR